MNTELMTALDVQAYISLTLICLSAIAAVVAIVWVDIRNQNILKRYEDESKKGFVGPEFWDRKENKSLLRK